MSQNQNTALVQHIQQVIVDNEMLGRAAHSHALEILGKHGHEDIENRINEDHAEYDEGLQTLYYAVLSEFQTTIVIRALANMNHSY